MDSTKLTQAELATNAETWDHINLVMKLLASAQIELMRRQFTHDRSKLRPPEVSTFTEFTPKLATSTYGSDEYRQLLADMMPALDHHYAHNRHHPEFFQNGVEGMNLFDLLEMLVDWYAATKRHNNGDIHRSIEINTKRFNLSPQLVQIFQNTVPWIDDEFYQYRTQRDIAYIRGNAKTHISGASLDDMA
jgi:hypothetical protein